MTCIQEAYQSKRQLKTDAATQIKEAVGQGAPRASARSGVRPSDGSFVRGPSLEMEGLAEGCWGAFGVTIRS